LGSTAYSDSNGRYALPTAKGGDNAYHVQAQGYSPQLATRAVLAQELELDFYLLPGPDFVANGGFEDGQAGWYAGQGLTFTQGDKGFGQGFVRFGGNLVPLPQSSAWVTLWQDLEIPESSHEPTLSLLYALGDGDGDPVGALQVIVSDEQREEVLATLNEATPWVIADENAHYPMWQHYHADLGEWAGRPITLKLRYDSGWTDSYALLDQVSIAPWLTPLVQEVTPKESTNETSLALTVEGTNFVAAPDSGTGPHVILGSRALDTTYVSDSVLQATVPAGFPPDLYDVWVRNPGGQRAVLDEGFALHSALMLPLVQKRFSLDTR
jgi:hypothetical protein